VPKVARKTAHIVERGDTLSRITEKYYGDLTLYPQLAEVNGIKNPDYIVPDQVIKLPDALYRANNVYYSPLETTIELDPTRRLCGCDEPEKNYPYDDDTFEMIRRIKDLVLKSSEHQDVPPVAVAGAIADEFNSSRGGKRVADWFQDKFYIHTFSNNRFRIAAILDEKSKLLNATKHDLGIGNIQLGTAKMLYDRYPESFLDKDWDYQDLVDYIQTDGGTCHLAALYIRYGWEMLADEIADYPLRRYEAVLVTFYKQGEEKYVGRFWERKEKDPSAKIEPGEGCRVCLQREKIMKMLGLS
jgi:LysM repeat protein